MQTQAQLPSVPSPTEQYLLMSPKWTKKSIVHRSNHREKHSRRGLSLFQLARSLSAARIHESESLEDGSFGHRRQGRWRQELSLLLPFVSFHLVSQIELLDKSKGETNHRNMYKLDVAFSNSETISN